MLIFQEPFCRCSSFNCLHLVPAEFCNIFFVAFHSNAIGGHLNAYRTLHCIWLRYSYWPWMDSYIKHMCNACPGFPLVNPTKSKSSKQMYNFSREAPFLIHFIDVYSAGKHCSIDGSMLYLIACCGMTWFASMEHVLHGNSSNFASGVMKIQLR